MTRIALATAALLAIAIASSPAPARAADSAAAMTARPASIAVTATGSVQYAPDIAHVSFGVRAQSAAASHAAAAVNTQAQSIVKALRGMGIADADIKISGYTLDYQQNDNSVGAPMSGGPMTGEVHRVLNTGFYVASESIDVTVPVARAGAAIDGAVKAGANQAYGLSYDTSQRDRLFREALAAAVVAAKEQASTLATAAGVQLGSVLSISTGGGGGPPMPMMGRMMMAANAPAPPVQGGTDTIEASVSVVYAIQP